jgi:hypothetical protein
MPPLEHPGDHEWRDQQPVNDVPFVDGMSALEQPHSEGLGLDSVGHGEITSPATAPHEADQDDSPQGHDTRPQPNIVPHRDIQPPRALEAAGALSIRGAETAPAPLPVLLQRLDPSEKPQILQESESAWLPPSETSSPEMADGMFEVLAGGPEAHVTDEDRQRVHQLYQTGVLEWAGSGIIPPTLDRLFGEKDESSGERQPTRATLQTIVGQQLSDLVGTLGDIEDGIRATDVLRHTTFRHETRPVVASEDIPEIAPGQGFEAGQFNVTVEDGIIIVAEHQTLQAAHRPAALLAYVHSANEVRLVNPDSHERYRIVSEAGQPHVIHDMLRGLEPGDSAYFTALGHMLNHHRQLLIRVISDAGVDLVTQFDVASGAIHRDQNARQEVDDKIGNLIASNGPASDLQSELIASTAIIYQHLRTSHSLNRATHRVDESGMRAVVTRMTNYYDAIVPRQTPTD